MSYAAITRWLGVGVALAGLTLAGPALAEKPRAKTTATKTTAKRAAARKVRRPAATRLQKKAVNQAIAEVVVLHGTNDGKGIDPTIGKLPQLKQPPFSSYDSYTLLKRSKMVLKGKVATLELPDKGKFKLELTDIKKEKRRYVLRASIIKPDGKTFLPSMKVNARAGDIFFIAGQKYKKGILVLGIRVKPQK